MADPKDDTNFFWQSKYGVSERNQGIVDGSDALANGGKFVISFHHIPTGKEVFFKAFITSYQENFNSTWKGETVYGRTDPIRTYANTERRVSFAFEVPASSEQEGFENMGRLQKLAQFSYPMYENTGDDQNRQYLITQAPLVRIKVMNLIQKNLRGPETFGGYNLEADTQTRSRIYGQYRSSGDAAADKGLLAAINNISFTTDPKNAATFEVGKNTVIPQNFSVQVDFSVIHEQTIGFDTEGNALNPGMPFDVSLKVAGAEKVGLYQTEEQRIQATRDRQAAEDIAAARFGGALGDKRAERYLNKYDRKVARGKNNSFDDAMADEAHDQLGTEWHER